MQVHTLRCFGAHPGHGNVALVIEGGPASEAARLALARERGQSACLFLDPRTGAGPAWIADYYYPHARSPLCLHATLAAARVLFGRDGQDQAQTIAIETAMRGQRLRLSRSGEEFFIGLERQPVPPVAVDAALAAWLLGEPRLRPAGTPLLASVGSPKLLVEVADNATLQALRPPLQRIVEWGQVAGVGGCYVYCRVGQDAYQGRNFNHLDPAGEDSATGVAAGALSAHLGRGITLFQGQARGQDCVIRTRVEGDAILVGGRAEG